MREVLIWPYDTRLCWDRWNKDTGPSLLFDFPYKTKPFEKIWEEKVTEDGYTYESEYEVVVKDKVWEQIRKYGDNNEKKEAIRYAHEDVLERGFTEEELKFLNAYKNRFLFIEILPITNGLVSSRDENVFIWDNLYKKKYPAPNMIYGKFETFHNELKKLKLI